MGEGKRTRVAGPLAILAGVLFVVAGVISGNYGLWVPIGALWFIVGAAALRRRRPGEPQTPNRLLTRPPLEKRSDFGDVDSDDVLG